MMQFLRIHSLSKVKDCNQGGTLVSYIEQGELGCRLAERQERLRLNGDGPNGQNGEGGAGTGQLGTGIGLHGKLWPTKRETVAVHSRIASPKRLPRNRSSQC